MQLEWGRHVHSHTGKPVLILCPLAVAAQTIEEGSKLGLRVIRASCDITNPHFASIQISNYEQIENIDCSIFGGIVLDESSILKNFTGATKKKLIESFKETPYKLCCTATPSPNDDMEICNHAEFLRRGRREEILATYFTHDGGETSRWRLKGHAQKPFWNFVKSWAIMCSNPADLGFDGSKYILPKLNLIERVIDVPIKQGKLFNDVSVSATNFNQELRITLIQRMDEVVSIVNGSDENFIVWVKQNKEADYLSDKIDCVEVRGDQDSEIKEKNLIGFAHGDFRVLLTKTKIACFGLNYQNCHNQVFASLDFSFEQLYQAIRRSYRFGQKHPVNIWLITTDTMQNVIAAIKEKQEQFENPDELLTLENGEPFEGICSQMENFGYQVETFGIPAACVEAWHQRDRIWIIAYSSDYVHSDKLGLGDNSIGKRKNKKKKERTTKIGENGQRLRHNINGSNPKIITNTNYLGRERRIEGKQAARKSEYDTSRSSAAELRDSWQRNDLPSPSLTRVDDGLPNRMDRIKALGNSIVPQVAFEIFKAIKATLTDYGT